MADEEKKTAKKASNASGDPGASRHGNFMNYYTFHSAEERAKQLPRGVWQRPTFHRDRKYIGLDVGCNVGDLTVLLQKFLHEEINDESVDVRVLGIDLDDRLIERARDSNKSPNFVTFEPLDIMNKNSRLYLTNYLEELSRKVFDVVFCFSITMWIHLNHGDSGLIDYLEALSSLANIIVIEPQSWKCYRNASRRLRRAGHQDFTHLNSIELNGNVANHIDRIIIDRGAFQRLAITEPNQWGRKLLIYQRKESFQL